MNKLLPFIKSLQSTTSRNDKEEILKSTFTGNVDLFKLLKYCYDPFIIFGVSNQTLNKCKTTNNGNNLSFSDFEALLLKLKNRELTGNAAIAAISEMSMNTDQDLWDNLCKPVLLKDMRCGFTDTTINKVLKGLSKKDKTANDYIISTFDVQLAFDGSEEVITGKKIVQVKLDGVRLITIVNIETKTVTQFTRNGKENNNFPHIKKIFEDLIPTLNQSYIFDGEIMSKSFQILMSQFSKKERVADTDTYLALFDCLPLSDFKKEMCLITQSKRIELLNNLVPDNDRVYKVPYSVFDLDAEQGKLDFNTFNQQTIDAGYEGIMIKNPDAPYELKRTKSWLKIKPSISISLPIIDCEEGSGKNSGSLGAFVCQGFDNSFEGKEIKVNCGSGFSDDQRKEFWNNRENMIGMIVEIKGDCLTLEEGSSTYSVRFPRFLGFRGNSVGEKL